MKAEIFLVLAFILTGCKTPDEASFEEENYSQIYYGHHTELEKKIIALKTETLTVEIADDVNKRTAGLMFRDSLPEGEGMLFVFERPHVLSFWMKNTSIALDIAFLDSDMVIREIKKMEPLSLENTMSGFSALYALEVNEGWFSSKNIGPGDKIEFIK
ncbi:DUF192 domain-containing protein [candidate division WOR-3 bacterium]|nr:DUF192 domain-containing protein [candidate division WOR-3 bacterium]